MQGRKEYRTRIYYNINLDSMIPDEHLLKKIERLVSFDFVRNKTKAYYSHTGKPSIDPVVLVKMLLIGYLFDIRSERKLVEDISLNLAYRWYIGYDLDEAIPDHSIFSKARARFGKKLFCQIFTQILKLAINYGLVSKEGILVDSTQVKADASMNSIVEVNLSPEDYWRKLDQSEMVKSSRGRKSKGSRPMNIGTHSGGSIDKDKIGKRRRRTNSTYLKKRSTTDPDATLFYRPGMGSFLSYKAHIATDLNGFITAVCASPSSSHDSSLIPELIESHEEVLGKTDWIAADTKYGSQECLGYLQKKDIKTAIKPSSTDNRPGYFPKEIFKYNYQDDLYICPQGKILARKAKNKKINRITYRAKVKDCSYCPVRGKCVMPNVAGPRIVSRYDSNYYDKARKWYSSSFGRILQRARKTVIEGLFGQAKTYHGMARAKFRGLSKVEIQFLLTATALNLKKLVRKLDVGKVKYSSDKIISNLLQFKNNVFRKSLIIFAN